MLENIYLARTIAAVYCVSRRSQDDFDFYCCSFKSLQTITGLKLGNARGGAACLKTNEMLVE